MDILIVKNTDEKRKIVEKCDSAFLNGLVGRKNYEEIFHKIDRYAIFIGVYEDGKIIGYAAIYANDQKSRTAFITMIGVLDYMQGKHVGSMIMNRCIAEAKKSGMIAIRLEVLNANTKAIHFYHHFGFVFESKCSADSNYLIKHLV